MVVILILEGEQDNEMCGRDGDQPIPCLEDSHKTSKAVCGKFNMMTASKPSISFEEKSHLGTRKEAQEEERSKFNRIQRPIAADAITSSDEK